MIVTVAGRRIADTRETPTLKRPLLDPLGDVAPRLARIPYRRGIGESMLLDSQLQGRGPFSEMCAGAHRLRTDRRRLRVAQSYADRGAANRKVVALISPEKCLAVREITGLQMLPILPVCT